VRADSAVLIAVADTTLVEASPDNNLGGALIVNAGTTQNFTRNHGLFRFDLTSQIPRGSIVSNVDFVVEVTGEPKDGFTPSPFGLHRVLKPWGEGGKSSPDPIHPGQGAPATTGEATWNDRFAFTTNTWTIPGGAATNDYVADLSAETIVYGIGDSPYTFFSTPALVADAQAWVDDPASNFGWMVVGKSEDINFTARRFASREATGFEPYLMVEYTPPPGINSVTFTNGGLTLDFTAQANQAYAVEFRDSFAATSTWSTLTNFAAPPATTNLVAFDSLAHAQRFYRLHLP
jgi:hypothetical protein